MVDGPRRLSPTAGSLGLGGVSSGSFPPSAPPSSLCVYMCARARVCCYTHPDIHRDPLGDTVSPEVLGPGSPRPSSRRGARHPPHRGTCPALARARAPTPTATPTGTQPSCPAACRQRQLTDTQMPRHTSSATSTQLAGSDRHTHFKALGGELARSPACWTGRPTDGQTRLQLPAFPAGPPGSTEGSGVQGSFPDAPPSCRLALGTLPLRLGTLLCEGTQPLHRPLATVLGC